MGLTYGSPEDMPPGLRRLYEQSLGKNGNPAPKKPQPPPAEPERPRDGMVDGTTPRLMIMGELPDLNTYIDAERGDKFKAASIKKKSNNAVAEAAENQLCGYKAANPVYLHYLWVMPNARKDLDNIAFAHKFVQDGLVQAGVLEGDSQRYVIGFDDRFYIDPEFPRVEVTIEEVPDGKVQRREKEKKKATKRRKK